MKRINKLISHFCNSFQTDIFISRYCIYTGRRDKGYSKCNFFSEIFFSVQIIIISIRCWALLLLLLLCESYGKQLMMI